MTVRITSNEPISFDISAELVGSIRTQLRADVVTQLTAYVDQIMGNDARVQAMMESLVEALRDEWTTTQFASMVADRMNYGYMVDAVRNEFIRHLLDDERFRSRMMRAISDATIGVTDEVVERVVATLDARNNPQADA